MSTYLNYHHFHGFIFPHIHTVDLNHDNSAGPYFECEASISGSGCPTAGCSAGSGISLVGEVQYCIDKGTITVEMKVSYE